MSSAEGMGAGGEEGEGPSPSLSLLQRLKRLREWQERQRQELLQTQAYTHTPSGPYLPSLKEEESLSESRLTEDSTPTRIEVPHRTEDPSSPVGLRGVVGPGSPLLPGTSNHLGDPKGITDLTSTPAAVVNQGCPSPAGLPVVGSASHGAPLSSYLERNPSEVEDLTPPPSVVPKGCLTPAGLSGVGPGALVVPVALDIQVNPPVSVDEERNSKPQEETPRETLPVTNNTNRGDVDAVRVWERERGTSSKDMPPPPTTPEPPVVVTRPTRPSHPPQDNDSEDCDAVSERQTSPLTSPEPSIVVPYPSHLHQSDREEGQRESYTREMKSDHDTRHTSLPHGSLSPHHDPEEYIDESLEDLLGGEERVPYRSEKYRSPPPPTDKDSRKMESSQAVKNLVPSRPFYSGLIKGSEGSLEGMEEAARPKRRFLKKGEGTARFRMRPMRLRSKREAEEESGGLDGRLQPQTPSPGPPQPPQGYLRLPMQNLQLHGASAAVGGQQRSLQEAPQGITEPVSVSTQHPAHPAWPHLRQQPTQPSLHPSTSQNPPRHPGSTQPSTHHHARPPPSPLHDLEKQKRREEAELSAFEKLEELAEDSSFSSNSSTVWGLLRQGQQSVSSTPMRTPPPFTLQETPVVASLNAQPKNLSESHFLGGLMNRVLPHVSGPQQQQQQQQQVAGRVDVKDVLAQLKAIVRLEGHSISDITESDVQSFLDGCSNGTVHLPPNAPHHPHHPHHTSTPVSPQPAPPPQARPHHVHFASEGVQVVEYQLSDTDGDDTMTDATSLDSDMITTSDLEALAHLSVRGVTGNTDRRPNQATGGETDGASASSSEEVTLTEQESPPDPQPVVLHFSPPPQRPPQSASHHIWSIFGKERDTKKALGLKPSSKSTKKASEYPPPQRPQQTETRRAPSVPQTGPKADTGQEELEVHKTLLLAKVAELEKETKEFKKENAKLQRLQQEVKEEKRKLEEEKRRMQGETAAERRKFQEYVDRERNTLWRERQQVLQRPPPPATPPQEHAMEVVQLREQVRRIQEEAQRKESLNQFTVKKLSDRIKTLETENKKLLERNNTLQALEKENQDLRLKADRSKALGRTRPAAQSSRPAQPSKATRGRPKTGTRPTTIEGVTKTLDALTKPQPMIIKEAQTRAPKTNKQDVVNNNLKPGHRETEEGVAKKGTNAETPLPQVSPIEEETPQTTSADDFTPSESRQPPWGVPGCTDEAGLDYTERVREDGVREVIYANGNRKEIHPSGDVTVSFYNGDRKEVKQDRTVYVYGSDHTSHTTYADGREELVFPSGQRETRDPDGSSEISFPDGSRKSVMSDGTEVCTTKDGSVVRTNPDGSKVFEFPSGQREVHRGGEKRREYPNGTVKIVHPDGRTETRYSSGRLRIKDREGNVILDSHVSLSSPPPPLHPHPPLPS